MPGAARANWARSSVKVSKVSSESTRRQGGPTPRPTTSKATFPKKTAGNLQPATGRADWEQSVSDLINCRPDTQAASATFPKKTAGNLQPATGRADWEQSVSDLINCRPDTQAASDSTTTRGYASTSAPPPLPAKTTGEYSSETVGPNVRATALVLETDGYSTRSKTNRSIQSSVTTPHGYHCRYRVL